MLPRRLLAPALMLFSISACAQTAPSAAPKPGARPLTAPSNFVPRPGVDFVLLDTPQPTWGQGAGKIEVAEVFSYRCSHCKDFQPLVNQWKKTRMPADVRWEYVPGVFGGTWDTFARAFFAAQTMGVQPQTHDKVFYGVFTEQAAGTGTLEDIAKMYSKWGVDQAKFLATMKSFGVNSKLTRAKQFAQRTGVTGTPTIIVNGKYRVDVNDRGFDGMLATAEYLIAQERAAMKKPAAKAK